MKVFFFFKCLFFWQLKLLNRIATVKHDGTVEFEVPADVIPQPIAVDREEDSKNGVCPSDIYTYCILLLHTIEIGWLLYFLLNK